MLRASFCPRQRKVVSFQLQVVQKVQMRRKQRERKEREREKEGKKREKERKRERSEFLSVRCFR